jgi:hypothetical protein
MRGPGSPYRSANSGEVSVGVEGRADLKQWYSAGRRFKNIEPVPVSGFQLMPGSFDAGPVRGRVGVAATSNVSPTPGPRTGTQTIWQADTDALNVIGLHCSGLDASAGVHSVQCEYLAAAVWKPIGTAVVVDTTASAITFALPPGSGVRAESLRLTATMTSSAQINAGNVTLLAEDKIQDAPRYASLNHDDTSRYFLSLQVGLLDIFENNVHRASVYLPEITETILPQVDFYTELATIGIFHRDMRSLRIRRSESDFRWLRDFWPYDTAPEVDLGGTYAKTSDQWDINVKWSASVPVYLAITVEGETTEGVPFQNTAGAAVAIGAAVDTAVTAAAIKAAVEALPSTGPTVTVSVTKLTGTDAYRVRLTFGGNLAGREFQIVSAVQNTAEAAALATHTRIGKTDFEPIISATRGYPGTTGLVQERCVYGDIKSVPAAIMPSAAGEYFDLDIKAAGDDAARLDRLRGQVSERVLAIVEATYLLVFTNRAVHFAPNRVIKKTEPLNFVPVSTMGLVPNCKPVTLEAKVYFIGANPDEVNRKGHQLLSLSYNEIETKFDADPEHIFAPHLVENVIRLVGQQPSTRADAARLWMLRSDGRLIQGAVIKSQDVLGYSEWVLAEQGDAMEVCADASNIMRVAVKRGGKMRHEYLSRSTEFQGAVIRQCDLGGCIAKLQQFEGCEVYVRGENYRLGPFRVEAGRIETQEPLKGNLQVGLWQPPVWESLPRYFITPNDMVIKRPGRIHAAHAQLIDTTSLAIGANGEPARNVNLAKATDTLDKATPARSGSWGRRNMLGHQVGTTLVVTQTFPGSLYVRELEIEEKL